MLVKQVSAISLPANCGHPPSRLPPREELQQNQTSLSPSHLPETLMRDCEEGCQCDNNYRNSTIQQLQKRPPHGIWKDTHAPILESFRSNQPDAFNSPRDKTAKEYQSDNCFRFCNRLHKPEPEELANESRASPPHCAADSTTFSLTSVVHATNNIRRKKHLKHVQEKQK